MNQVRMQSLFVYTHNLGVIALDLEAALLAKLKPLDAADRGSAPESKPLKIILAAVSSLVLATFQFQSW